MVNDRGITLYYSIHGEVTPISSIGDLSILEYLYSHFDSINGSASVTKE
jgi:hypothetical protein